MIWSNPGSYSPVMIPSQMVRTKPEQLGSKSYFSKIEMTRLDSQSADTAIKLFETTFDKSKSKPEVYSLDVISSSGKTLKF